MQLQPISIFHLTLMEAGQFIKLQLTSIQNLVTPEFLTNEDFDNYFQRLDGRQQEFAKALVPVRTNDTTVKIEAQDQLRDKAFILLKKAIGLHKFSEYIEKQDAARSLTNLFKAYKNLDKRNYGAESIGIDELLTDLGNSKYEPMVDLLGLSGYVNSLRDHNNQFKVLFSGRTDEVAQQETFDAKKLKNEMLAVYTEFSEYVVVMTRLSSSDPGFKEVLNVMNTNRKYYADILARRRGVAAEAV